MKMNRLILILIMLSYAEVKAQFTKGTFLFGGSIGGSYSTSTSTVYLVPSTFVAGGGAPPTPSALQFSADKTNTIIAFSPQIGYFIKDNFSLGFRFGWANLSVEEKFLSYNNNNSQSVLSVEPFLRYYLNKFFIQGSFGIGSSNSESKLEYAITPNGGGSVTSVSQNLKRNASTLSGSVSIGRAFLISKQLALEPLVGYQFTKFSNKDIPDEKVSTFYLAAGLQYYLSK
jgi:hypothetical protein